MIVGIDLGTTNSLVAYYSEDGPKIIPNRLGKNLTPSVISIDTDGTVYIGETARERKANYPLDTAEVFKRSMGTNREYKLAGNTYSAVDLSSMLLKALKEDAEHFLNETVDEAIISVPAYFNDDQRKATKKAGEMAGFIVERIVNEPTAAAIAYGLHKRDDYTKFLVFDLGGGTFDISILEMFNNIMEVHCVAGDNFLGGEDFTDILVSKFLKEKDIELSSLTMKQLSHVRKQAELCKLSFEDNKKATMRCNLNGESYEYEISLAEYEIECKPLLEKLRKPIERSLKDAKIGPSDIDEIVLVGGSTKLGIVRKFVSKLFARIPDTTINPDEAVAIGVAIQAAMKERNEFVKETILTDVCPFTLGTEVVSVMSGNHVVGGRYLPIIERNTVIPVSRTETLYTVYDNQEKLTITILQGESRFAKNNLTLGEINVKVPVKPAGEESVTVTYTYDINALLEVIVKVNSTGETKKTIIQKDDREMTKEEMEKRMEELNYLKTPPIDQEVNKLLLFRGERMYEEAIGDTRTEIDIILRKFEEALLSQNDERIRTTREETKKELNRIEESDSFNL